MFQVLSGRSASCSLFDNSRGGSLTGVTPLAPEPVRAERFLALAEQKLSRPEFETIVAEMRADYVAQYLKLLGKLTAPRILLWLSRRTPAYQENYDEGAAAVLGDFPQLVNESMVAEIAAHCDEYVEVASTSGLPHRLWRAEQPIEGAQLRDGQLVNLYYPSPEMHAEAGDKLAAPCQRFWAPAGSPPAARFVVVGPERSGTNLLVGMLNQHRECFCGGELFNGGQIAKGKLAWFDLPAARARPAYRLAPAGQAGVSAGALAGCGRRRPQHGRFQAALQSRPRSTRRRRLPRSRPEIRVIHVTRRNLLRRLVSNRQAQATNQWAVGRDGDMQEPPEVELDLNQALRSFSTIESQQAANAQRFAGHRVLRVVYEDLAARPEVVGVRAARFLGLPPLGRPPVVNYKKTGVSDLKQAVVGYSQLRAQARRWAAYFDE